MAGFVGSHLAEILVNANFSITGIDNLSKGSSGNIKHLKKFRNFFFAKGDICDKGFMKEQLKDVDVLFHEAALTDVIDSISNPSPYFKTNVEGTEIVLEAARINDVERVVFASSCAVYGGTKRNPIVEDAPLQAMSPYAETKIIGEKLCRRYHEEQGLKVVTLRYFNVFGLRQTLHYSGVISEFIKRALEDKPLTVYGDGKQIRDFIYIDDVVNANALAAENKAAIGEAFNVGSGEGTTINHLAKTILRVLGKENLYITHASRRAGEIRYSLSDITKIKKALGFKPKYSLESGIKDMIDKMLGN